MKITSDTRNHFCGLLLLLLLPSSSNSQVIPIEEFVQRNLASREITETFSYDCPDKFYNSTYSDKYLAVTLSRPKNIISDEGPKTIFAPYSIEIFNSQGELSNIKAKYEHIRVAGFLKNHEDSFVLEQWDKDNHDAEIFDLTGNPIKQLNCGNYFYCSPTGAFYYNSGLESASVIYDKNGHLLFQVPHKSDKFVTTAVSDSTLLLANGITLSYWNVNTQEAIWETTIPTKRKGIPDLSSHIQYSMPGNIIVLNSFYGYYCFDFQAAFLWADEDYGFMKNEVRYTGVSKSNGDVVIIYTKFNNQHSLFARIFDHEGVSLGEHAIELGDDVIFAANYGSTAMAFNDYILIRISVINADQSREYATCILYKENRSWDSAVVSGFWHLLKNDEQAKSLVGYDSNSKQIRGFQIK